MITISLDVLLLDKTRFKRITRKNGKEAVFCDLVLFECKSEWGDYLVKQQVTKEERAARKEMPILGNGKIIAPTRSQNEPSDAPVQEPSAAEDDGSQVPF